MLDKMRKQSQSTLIVILFGFIIFVFVFSFGAGSVGFRRGGCGRTALVAVVNGEDVSEMEFQFQYEQAARSMAGRGDHALGREGKLQLRRQVLEEMVDRKLLVQEARRFGLHVTDQERNQSIRDAFRDKEGRFDLQRYKFYLTRYLNTTPAVFEESWRERMLAARMAEVIQGTSRVTEDELREAFRLQETKVRLKLVRLPLKAFWPTAEPAAAELEKFRAENAARIEEYYRQNSADYNKPKKVELAHVFFEVRQEYDQQQIKEKHEQAALTAKNLQKGIPFEQEVKDYSEDEKTREQEGRLGEFTREELVARFGEAVAEAAFALGAGATSEVVRSEKGFHVFKCLKITPAEEHPLKEVENEIAAKLLQEERARAAARAEAERLMAGLRQGKSLEQMVPPPPAGQEEDPLAIRVQDTGLFAWMSGFVPGLGVDEGIAQAAFALDAQRPLPESYFEMKSPFGGEALVVLKLEERQEPDWNAFPQARTALTERVLYERRSARLTSWLARARKSADVQYNQALLGGTPRGPSHPVEDDW